jgi:topoisomerase-4 subunit B
MQTPLLVRNKTIYCYTDDERKAAIEKLKPKPEITDLRFGEISLMNFSFLLVKTFDWILL